MAMSGKGRVPALFGLGLAGSQAGHLLAYQVQFGAAAQQVESTGAHQYFPLLAKTSLGVAAIALVAVLFLIGLARTLGPRQRVQGQRRGSYLALLAALFTLQFALFSTQEVVEALVTGSAAASATHLLLWGTLGQLPVAAVASLAWGWLATRFESAIGEITANLEQISPPPVPALVPVYTPAPQAWIVSRSAGRALVKRGPPPMRLSSY